MLQYQNARTLTSVRGIQDSVEDDCPLNQGVVENKSFTGLEDGPTLPSSFTDTFGFQGRVFSRKFKRLKRDIDTHELRDTDASGAGLVRCPFCKELYMIKCQLKILICPNGNCCKSTATSPKPLALSGEEADVRVNDDGEMDPIEKVTDSVTFKMGKGLPPRAAVINCSSCAGKIMKFGSCNRLTCFCGQSICFMCRGILPKNSRFEHFCFHERYHSGLPCKLCKLCDLYDAQVANGRQKQQRPRHDCDVEFVQKRKCEEDAAARRSAVKAWFSCTSTD